MSGGVLILNSRQSLYPHGGLRWVQQTHAAVQYVKQSQVQLIAIANHPTWALQIALAEIERVPIRILNCDEETVRDAHLQLMHEADFILPISIRPRGMIDSLLREPTIAARIDHRFSVPYEKNIERVNGYAELGLAPSVKLSLPVNPADYLFHWTRATRTGWPNEARQEFYQAILSASDYPRTAFATVQRILHDRLLMASNRHMRKDVKVVSFTGRHPNETLGLMRWRRRYCEMSFEPYAVGIHREWAAQAGVRPVVYLSSKQKSESAEMTSTPNWLTQGAGKNSHWIPENEYRAWGNIRLPEISPELIAIAYRRSEAETIMAQSQLECGYFMDDLLSSNSATAQKK